MTGAAVLASVIGLTPIVQFALDHFQCCGSAAGRAIGAVAGGSVEKCFLQPRCSAGSSGAILSITAKQAGGRHRR